MEWEILGLEWTRLLNCVMAWPGIREGYFEYNIIHELESFLMTLGGSRSFRTRIVAKGLRNFCVISFYEPTWKSNIVLKSSSSAIPRHKASQTIPYDGF